MRKKENPSLPWSGRREGKEGRKDLSPSSSYLPVNHI
jgi:hypothetical protein